MSEELTRALNRIVGQALGRPRRYVYWEHQGRLFCYATEPDAEHRFASWDYVPYGPGARSGKATRWRMAERVDHSLRRQAKARAWGRYQKAVAG